MTARASIEESTQPPLHMKHLPLIILPAMAIGCESAPERTALSGAGLGATLGAKLVVPSNTETSIDDPSAPEAPIIDLSAPEAPIIDPFD